MKWGGYTRKKTLLFWMIINVLIEVLIFEAMVSAESLGMMGGLTYSLLKAIARTKAIKFLLNFVTTRWKDVFSETGFHLIDLGASLYTTTPLTSSTFSPRCPITYESATQSMVLHWHSQTCWYLLHIYFSFGEWLLYKQTNLTSGSKAYFFRPRWAQKYTFSTPPNCHTWALR